MTPEEDLIQRYIQWLTSGTWASEYWKNKTEWRIEIEQKIKELESILNKS